MNRSLSAAHRGFTLLELLLVITIIGILAGMLMPVTSTVIARAQTTKCMSNLRQIGMAANSAAADNDNTYPLVEIDPNDPIYQTEGALPITQVFTKYGITPEILQCAVDLKGPNWFAKTGSSYMWQPYSEDEPVAAITIYTRRGQFPASRTSRVRLATDYEPVHGSPVVGGRKMTNTLYADGHVTLR